MIEENGLDERIYELNSLNFLEISETCLDSISNKISNLSSLIQLCLTHNKLQSIPSGIGQLCKLRFLDLSFNNLLTLPDDIFLNLTELTNLVLSGNKLGFLPSVQGLQSLHNLIAPKNKLKVFLKYYYYIFRVYPLELKV